MLDLSKEQARVLRALYGWCVTGRGEGDARKRVEHVPDYVLAVELEGEGIDASECLEEVAARGLVRCVGRGVSSGEWPLPGGGVLCVKVHKTRGSEAEPLRTELHAQVSGGLWLPISELTGTPCGNLFELTPAGVEAGSKLPDRPAAKSRAGAAFLKAIENDPKAQAAVQRAQARLRAITAALKTPEYQRERERARREQKLAFRMLAEAMQDARYSMSWRASRLSRRYERSVRPVLAT